MDCASATATVAITVDGRTFVGQSGQTVASLLLTHGVARLRRSAVTGAPRGAFCLMGICQECVVTIDGALRQSCLVAARDGMQVELSRG